MRTPAILQIWAMKTQVRRIQVAAEARLRRQMRQTLRRCRIGFQLFQEGHRDPLVSLLRAPKKHTQCEPLPKPYTLIVDTYRA